MTARIHDMYRAVEERKQDFREVEKQLTLAEAKEQTQRCLNCGIPFCHGAGCPLGNLVPDQNRAVAAGDMKRAYELLSVNSFFPEFTGRICPALCEAGCVHQLDEESVMVRQTEKTIIETAFANGWVLPRPPSAENGKRMAVIGSGPSGLSAAQLLRRRGYDVTVYEKSRYIGGLLRYGIPDFKLAKSIIERRRALMEAEGIRFITGIEVSKDISADYLARSHDGVVLAIGTPAARDINVPGRSLPGIYPALVFLANQNRINSGEIHEYMPSLNAKGKHVLVIGGGDTGSDCVGTAIRQGASSVTQIEIMPKPPATRSASTPWPQWPYLLRTSSSHLEGCDRRWNLNTICFIGKDRVEAVETQAVSWELSPEGRPLKFSPDKTKKSETLKADLVLLAMGFTGVPKDNAIVSQLTLSFTPRNGILSDPARGIFSVGDCASGASLVVRAIASARDRLSSL